MPISLSEAVQRLTESAGSASGRYQRGVQGKGGAWQTGASGAVENYNSGVQAAVAEGRFGKGVSEAGAASYDEGVRVKGVTNYPTGLRLAGNKYSRKVQKFVPLWGAALPTPRGAKRSPTNLQRMNENVSRFIDAAK